MGEELLALENYWKERLATQEAETVHRQKLTEQEVAAAAKKVEELFRPAPQQEAAKPCKDMSLNVQSCYSSNPSQPLLCRDQVAQFSQCARLEKPSLEIGVKVFPTEIFFAVY